MAQTKAQLLGPVVGDVVMDVSTLSLDAEGNKVGIGHTEPDLTLHVNGVDGLPSSSGSTPTGHLTIRNKATSTKGMFLGVSDASPFGSWIQAQDATNNATNYPLLLNPNGGNVGIGTNSPDGKLDVRGTIFVNGDATGGRIFASGGSLSLTDGNGRQTLRIDDPGAGNTHTHVFDSNGRLGIGTDNPARKVEIFDTAATVLQLNSTNSGGTSLRIQNSGTDKMYMGLAGDFIIGQGSNVTDSAIRASGALLFASGGGTERLRITSDGNVGIGTTDPGALLHLESTAANAAGLRIGFDSPRYYDIFRGSTTNSGYLNFYGSQTGFTGYIFDGVDGERMRIKSNGQVLIGNHATHGVVHGNLEVNGNDGINISNATRSGANGAQWRLIPHNGGGSATNLRLYEGAGSVEVLNVTKTGRIGVNRLTPSFMLDIVGNSSTGANCIRIVDGAETGHGSHPSKIVAGGTYYQEMQMHGRRFAVHTYDGSSISESFRVHQNGFVGIGVDSPAVKLDVKKAAAGTIARFYDDGSNGGALYNSAPIMGLSRVSNGGVSLDGLFFQVGWDKTNSTTYNITETVFAVGNKGVGVGEDDPQVWLHLSKPLSATTSYKDAQMIRIAGTNGANTMAGIGFGYHTTNPAGSAYPSAWIGAKVSSWTQYVKHDLVFATRDSDSNVEPEERFRITEAGQLIQDYNSQYIQRGYFDTQRSSQNASNCPTLATTLSYAFGYQEAFGTSGGGWSYPYPDLVLGYHTGIRFGGHPNYQGCRFYADHPSISSTVLLSIGNGSNNVVVTNTLSKGGGTFRIAHPHPSKKYTHDLQHSFIEGPQCDNLYRGRVDLVDGTATVNIDTVSNMTDGTFVLLNRDIQCFTSNETGWDPVKGSVSGNILTITSQNNSSTDTISWMVIGERQDDKIKSLEMEMTDSDGKLIVEPLTIEESHM